MNEEGPEPGKGVGTFSFWDGFEAGIQSTGSLPDLHLLFALGCADSISGKNLPLQTYSFIGASTNPVVLPPLRKYKKIHLQADV